MKDSTLIRLALACSVIGICTLFIISLSIKPESIYRGELEDAEGDSVMIKGRVLRVMESDDFSILTIERIQELKVVAFDNASAEQGTEIIVEGKVEEYEGEMEIVADRISCIR